MNDKKERDAKAGSPIFIIIIFVALLGFIFYVPELYAKYHKNVAEFLGIGSKNQGVSQGTKTNDKKAVSEYYQIGSNKELVFNELKISGVTLENNILSLDVEVDKEIDLENTNYYLEFYEERQTFLGRRMLKGSLNEKGRVSVDTSGMKVTTVTYFTVSHIGDDNIPKSKLDTDESGLGDVSCSKGDIIYEYNFNIDKLYKVTKKYTFTSSDLSEYSNQLLVYQREVNRYNDLNGVTATIVENGATFIYTLELDYTDISEFASVRDNYKFKKDTLSHILKFKMDAEGFTCV